MRIDSYVTDRAAIRSVAGPKLAPIASGVVLPLYNAPEGALRAVVLDADPLDHPGDRGGLDLDAIAASPVTNVILWTGSLAAQPFARDIQTWGQAGRDAFDALRNKLRERLERKNVHVLWRPHARHVISDVQRALALALEQADDERFGLALDLTSLLEPSMLDTGADHIERALEALGPHADLVIVTGPQLPEGRDRDAPDNPEGVGDRPPLVVAGVHEGVIDPVSLGSLLRAHVLPETPVALLAEDVDLQLQSMGLIEIDAKA